MKIGLLNNQIYKIPRFSRYFSEINNNPQKNFNFALTFKGEKLSHDEFSYENSNDELQETQTEEICEDDNSSDSDEENVIILTNAEITELKDKISRLESKIKTHKSAITKLREEIESEKEKEARMPNFVSEKKKVLVNQLNSRIKSLNKLETELQEKQDILERYMAQTKKDFIIKHPERYLPYGVQYSASPIKRVIGKFTPIENQDEKQSPLYDMSDPRNLAVIERAKKLLPRKSRFYADCDAKEKWVPAFYLAKLGFGSEEKLKQMVEKGRLKGTYRITPVDDKKMNMLWIEIKNAEPKLDQLREEEGYVSISKFWASRTVMPEIFINLILEGKIKSIEEFIYSQDYNTTFINKNDPEVKAAIKKYSQQSKFKKGRPKKLPS